MYGINVRKTETIFKLEKQNTNPIWPWDLILEVNMIIIF